MASDKDGEDGKPVGGRNGDDRKRFVRREAVRRMLRDADLALEFPGGKCPECGGTPASGHLPGFECGKDDSDG